MIYFKDTTAVIVILTAITDKQVTVCFFVIIQRHMLPAVASSLHNGVSLIESEICSSYCVILFVDVSFKKNKK